MKEYSKPLLEYVELRVEERLAGSVCQKSGACPIEVVLAMQEKGLWTSYL